MKKKSVMNTAPVFVQLGFDLRQTETPMYCLNYKEFSGTDVMKLFNAVSYEFL
jgi:hypothetical protein